MTRLPMIAEFVFLVSCVAFIPVPHLETLAMFALYQLIRIKHAGDKND